MSPAGESSRATLFNPATKIRLEILRSPATTGDVDLEWLATYPPASVEPPAHLHPQQTEYFEVRAGSMTARVDGVLRVLGVGDTLTVPAGAVHAMWNHTREPATMLWRTHPGLRTEALFGKLCSLAEEGRTSRGGRPGTLQSAVLAFAYRRELRLVKPARWVQLVVIPVLALAGRLLGHRATPEPDVGRSR